MSSLPSKENLNEIKKFELLIVNTENKAKNNKNLFFRDKSLLLEQTRNLKLKCKYLKNDEKNKSLQGSNTKKHCSKSTISHAPMDFFNENLSFCQKSNRTDDVNLMESKFSDPSNNVKNPLKFSNASTFFNDNDLSTTIPHSAFDKGSENSKTFKIKENEYYEKKINLLEEKIKELRFELGKKEKEIKGLKNGFFQEDFDFNDVFDSVRAKKIGFKKICNDYKIVKRNYEVKLKNQEKKSKKIEEIYKKQQNEMERMENYIEEIIVTLQRNEKEFEIVQRNNQILLENLKENEGFKQTICKSFEKFRLNMEEKLKLYASKLQKLNENEKLIERISAENQDLKTQKNFLLHKVKLI